MKRKWIEITILFFTGIFFYMYVWLKKETFWQRFWSIQSSGISDNLWDFTSILMAVIFNLIFLIAIMLFILALFAIWRISSLEKKIEQLAKKNLDT